MLIRSDAPMNLSVEQAISAAANANGEPLEGT